MKKSDTALTGLETSDVRFVRWEQVQSEECRVKSKKRDGVGPTSHFDAVGASRREARQMQDRSVYCGSS